MRDLYSYYFIHLLQYYVLWKQERKGDFDYHYLASSFHSKLNTKFERINWWDTKLLFSTLFSFPSSFLLTKQATLLFSIQLPVPSLPLFLFYILPNTEQYSLHVETYWHTARELKHTSPFPKTIPEVQLTFSPASCRSGFKVSFCFFNQHCNKKIY